MTMIMTTVTATRMKPNLLTNPLKRRKARKVKRVNNQKSEGVVPSLFLYR